MICHLIAKLQVKRLIFVDETFWGHQTHEHFVSE